MAAAAGNGVTAPGLLGETELIARIVDGDEAAFEIIYNRYFPRVHSFVARRISNHADAEETTQEVFINVFSSLHSFRAEAPFAAWVLGVARRTIANRFKKKRHVTVPLEGEENLDIDPLHPTVRREPTPLENYECRERIAGLEHAARTTLSAEQAELFELHHLRHRSIHDIARSLDKSEDAVKSNLYRARKLLLAQ